LNLRPLGPEPNGFDEIPESFRNFSQFGSPQRSGCSRPRACHGQVAGLSLGCYCDDMTFKARVKAGRLVVDEPTDLPEGTEVELLPLDPGDWLDEEDRAALHKALSDSEEDVKAGRLVDADAILRELRSR
jgi:hypothetical protein